MDHRVPDWPADAIRPLALELIDDRLCQHRADVYNSCLDRLCPLCRGGRRATWLDKTAELLLPKIE